MEKEKLFAKALQETINVAKKQGNVITKAQAEENFESLDLSKEQLEMVYEYLYNHKIGVEQAVDLDNYLSSEEKDYLSVYLEEIEQLPKVSDGEREAILLSAMAGEEGARQKVIELFLGKVVEVAKLYTGQGVYLEDLIGEGNIALTAGANMLGCLEHASEADGMLGKMIMDAMEDFINEELRIEEGQEDDGE